MEAVDSLGVWYKCEAVEVKDEDHYLVKQEIRHVTASGKQKCGPSAEPQVISQNLRLWAFGCLQT